MKCNENVDKDYIKSEIAKGQSEAFAILPTILMQYGRLSYKRLSIWLLNDDIVDGYYNHIDYYIKGFIRKEGTTYVKVSWQLDNADGEELVEMPKPYDSAKVEINANLYFYVDSDDIYQAIKNLKL